MNTNATRMPVNNREQAPARHEDQDPASALGADMRAACPCILAALPLARYLCRPLQRLEWLCNPIDRHRTVMTRSSTPLPRIKGDPQRVLSAASRAYGRQLAADPKQAEAFLKRAGLIVRAGKLAAPYK